MILEFCKEPKTAIEIKKYLKIKSRQYVSAKIIKPLINAGSLEYTNKLNINARNQKYLSISNYPFNNKIRANNLGIDFFKTIHYTNQQEMGDLYVKKPRKNNYGKWKI